MIASQLTRSLNRIFVLRTTARQIFASHRLNNQLNYEHHRFAPVINRIQLDVVRTFISSRNFCTNVVKSVDLVVYEDVKKLSLEDNPPVLMIDVRNPEELIETTQIRNTINIPKDVFVENFKLDAVEFKNKFNIDKPDLNAAIITMCKKGKTGEEAALILKGMGYTNVKLYRGSYVNWAEREGLPPPA